MTLPVRPDAEDQELEQGGAELLVHIGVPGVNPLFDALKQELDPDGTYVQGDSFEFDYLVPVGRFCLVGEITARTNPSKLRAKFRSFVENVAILRRVGPSDRVWRLLGVPDERLREFRDVKEFRAFFIATRLTGPEAGLPYAPLVARLYRGDWELLQSYALAIGRYAGPLFLAIFDLGTQLNEDAILAHRDQHKLVHTTNRCVAHRAPLADVFTFETSPYKLLRVARVFRHDLLPDLGSAATLHYQRPLLPTKLTAIRRRLLSNPDFMFPGTILVVLTERCLYDPLAGVLMIPAEHGSVAVIDGQHRLFSYADDDVKQQVEHHARIMVTAVRFATDDLVEVMRSSASLFIEINTNQTRVSTVHLAAIAYPVLGDVSSIALAAQVLLRVNERAGSPVAGLFDFDESGRGLVSVEPMLRRIRPLVDRRHVNAFIQRELEGSDPVDPLVAAMRRVYDVERLSELSEPETLIAQATGVLNRVLVVLKRVFEHDWPEAPGATAWFGYGAALEAAIRLSIRLLAGGRDIEGLREEWVQVRANVLELCGKQTYTQAALDPTTHGGIPGPRHAPRTYYTFLEANRTAPTPIDLL